MEDYKTKEDIVEFAMEKMKFAAQDLMRHGFEFLIVALSSLTLVVLPVVAELALYLVCP